MTVAIGPAEVTLDTILGQLDRFHQRATYGAVAALVNSAPRSLMAGRARSREASWVVRRQTGKPTGYLDEQTHPDLGERDHVIDNPDELRRWLADPR